MSKLRIGDAKEISIGPGTDYLVAYGLQEPLKLIIVDILPHSLVVMIDAIGEKPFIMTIKDWGKF